MLHHTATTTTIAIAINHTIAAICDARIRVIIAVFDRIISCMRLRIRADTYADHYDYDEKW